MNYKKNLVLLKRQINDNHSTYLRIKAEYKRQTAIFYAQKKETVLLKLNKGLPSNAFVNYFI